MNDPATNVLPSVTAIAPAKINLFLHIVGRRGAGDENAGFHELESLFVFTRGGDQITVRQSRGFTFGVGGPFAAALNVSGSADDNLVCRAARALADVAGNALDVHIELTKNLPVAAGIGGGSADAAATLIALNDFWALGMTKAEMEPIALSLGADVPACLYHTPLFVRGIGERMTPAAFDWQGAVLLVNPGAALSTQAVFKAFHAAGTPFDKPLSNREASTDVRWWSVAALSDVTHNSLERPAATACPEIDAVLSALETQDGVRLARMSGSGATCFALFDDRASASAAETRVQSLHPDWWTMVDTISQ